MALLNFDGSVDHKTMCDSILKIMNSKRPDSVIETAINCYKDMVKESGLKSVKINNSNFTGELNESKTQRK